MPLINKSRLRRIEWRVAIDITHAAEENGLATFLVDVNLGLANRGSSCSCCGDCCYTLCPVNEFEKPGIIAPPHFHPVFMAERCSAGKKYAARCPMTAITHIHQPAIPFFNPRWCIGCGICLMKIPSKAVIKMDALPGDKQPPKLFASTLLRNAPDYVVHAVNTWRKSIHPAPDKRQEN